MSAKKMASYFNNEFKQLRSVNVRATAHNEIKVQSLDCSITGLLINNEAITYAATTDISGMIQAINEKSAVTNVRADWLVIMASRYPIPRAMKARI